jgi:ribosomal protein S18 acetylase RimI-like enzyme
MIIRLATTGDAELLAELNRDVQQIHAEAWPSFFREATNQAEVAHWFETILRKPENRVFVGEVDGLAFGYIYCEIARRPQNPFNRPRDFVYIHQISVKPDYRKLGYGKQLMLRVNELARAEGIEQVLLDTWSFNSTAKKFFGDLGFVVFNERMRLEVD